MKSMFGCVVGLPLASTPHAVELADNTRTLILYSYFETELALPNLEYFIAVGIPYYLNQTDVDFVIILNSLTLSHRVKLPFASNIYVIQRPNVGMDLCAYRSALDHWTNITEIQQRYGNTASWSTTYKRIILLNASVRGPFVPNYVGDDWIPLFTSPLSSSIKLVGTTINCYLMDRTDGTFPDLHIQSMVLAFSTDVAHLMYSQLVCCNDKWDTIFKGEVALTRHIVRDHGYNIAVTSLFWRDFDFTNKWSVSARCRDIRRQQPMGTGDHNFEEANLGTTITPIELVFIKTNRGLDPLRQEVWTQMSLKVAAKRWRAIPISDDDIRPNLILPPLNIPGKCLELDGITVIAPPSEDNNGAGGTTNTNGRSGNKQGSHSHDHDHPNGDGEASRHGVQLEHAQPEHP
jgi:hypothetical protein